MSSLLSGIRFVSKAEPQPVKASSTAPGHDTKSVAGTKRPRSSHDEHRGRDRDRDKDKKHKRHSDDRKSHKHHKHKKESRHKHRSRSHAQSDDDSDENERREARRRSESQSSYSAASSGRRSRSPSSASDGAEAARRPAWLNPALEQRLTRTKGSAPHENSHYEVPITSSTASVAAKSRMDWMMTEPAFVAPIVEAPAPAIARSGDLLTAMPAGLSFPTRDTNTNAAIDSAEPAGDHRHKLLKPVVASSLQPDEAATPSSTSSWRKRLQERAAQEKDKRTPTSSTDTTANGHTHSLTWQKKPEVTAQRLPSIGEPDVPDIASAACRDALQPIANAAVEHSISAPAPQRFAADWSGTATTVQSNVANTTLASDVLTAGTAAKDARGSYATAPILSQEDLNKLHARALRAQMMGDADKYTSIMKEIENANTAREMQMAAIALTAGPAAMRPSYTVDHEHAAVMMTVENSGQAHEVISTFDRHGMPIKSLQAGSQATLEREDLRSGSRQGKKKDVNKLDETGGRHALLREDNRETSIKDLLRDELTTSAGSLDENIALNIARAGTKFKGAGFVGSKSGVDEDVDDALEDIARLVEDPDAKLTARAKQEKDMDRAVAAHQQMSRAIQRCWYCFEGPTIKKHLVIALGEYSMLMLSPEGEKLPGHCLIVPLPHIAAMTDADDAVYDEVNKFKSALHQMYQADDEDVLFLETSLQKKNRHAVIDVVPMDKEIAFDAPLFFRKEMVDAEEWTSNKDLIDTAGKGLRGCIPKGFPYFHVAWRGGGFVHPIEEESEFPVNFGIDVCAGMLGLPPGRWDRKGSKRRTFDQERQAVLDFLKRWEPFDWTQQLDA